MPPLLKKSPTAPEISAGTEDGGGNILKMPCWLFCNDGVDILHTVINTTVYVLQGVKLSDRGGFRGCPTALPATSLSYWVVAVVDLLCPGHSSQLPFSPPSCVLFREIKLLFQCAMMNVIRSPYLMCPWITFKYVTANQAVIALTVSQEQAHLKKYFTRN